MKYPFFDKAVNVAAVTGVSYFGFHYMKAVVDSYHHHCEHLKKYPDAKINSTMWSRFRDTYLSSILGPASPSKAVKNEEESQTKTISKGPR